MGPFRELHSPFLPIYVKFLSAQARDISTRRRSVWHAKRLFTFAHTHASDLHRALPPAPPPFSVSEQGKEGLCGAAGHTARSDYILTIYACRARAYAVQCLSPAPLHRCYAVLWLLALYVW